jgi:hypothetical protein
MYFGCTVCFASLPLFVPTIISKMGVFAAIQPNGLFAAPYLLCWLMIVLVAFVSEHSNIRGPFAAGPALVAAVGYMVLGTSIAVAVRYFAFFLSVQIFIGVTLVLMWAGNTHATDPKGGGALAMLATGGQVGPVLGTNIFHETDTPYYRKTI